jgi:hypothetical protein
MNGWSLSVTIKWWVNDFTVNFKHNSVDEWLKQFVEESMNDWNPQFWFFIIKFIIDFYEIMHHRSSGFQSLPLRSLKRLSNLLPLILSLIVDEWLKQFGEESMNDWTPLFWFFLSRRFSSVNNCSFKHGSVHNFYIVVQFNSSSVQQFGSVFGFFAHL